MATAATVDLERRLAAERAVRALYESADLLRLPVTFAFLGACLLVTIPSLVHPDLYDVFGGIEPRRHWWQLFTAAFEHGWPGFHGLIHLALNVFLIFECGRPCERLLGSGRFLGLGLMSLGANAVAQLFAGGVNGSSLVIWSWGPPLVVALVWANRRGAQGIAEYQRLRGILVLMYGIIVVVMALLPYLGGWRGNLLVSLLLGNLYHLVAAGVGTFFALYFAEYIRSQMARLGEVG